MNKIKKIVVLMLLCLALVMSFVGCGGSSEEEKKDITVTFMNGNTKLGTVTAKEGEKVAGYEGFEKVEGFEFLGWYETPTFLETSKKDLKEATFDKDTTLYGSFKSTNVAEDTRVWYIVGTGTNPQLAASNWAGSSVSDADKEACKLVATGKNTNEFSITLNLYEGDQFQVIHDWSWDGQKGFGCFTTIDETQLANGGGLGGSSATSNINVVVEGNYTITLTTDPDNAALDTLVAVRNGDATEEGKKPEEPTTEAYKVTEATGIVVKGSWVSDWSENKDLSRIDGTNKFAITMELEAGIELYFMVYDNGADTGMGMNGTAVVDDASKALLEEAYNIKVKDAGTYTFTVDADTMTIVVNK